MATEPEWLGLADAVHRAGGQFTYWGLYTLAMRNQIESRRQGKFWQVRTAALDRYVATRARQETAGSS